MTATAAHRQPGRFGNDAATGLIFVRVPRPRPPTRWLPTQIAGNFQSFLTLLTTQLQNQNPLDPLDTNQFTQQLVEFAGVQQQLNTNDSLATLVSLQQTAQSTQALGFVGKTAVVNGSTAALTNSSATWELSVPTNSNVNIIDHQQHRADRLHRQLRRQRRQQPAVHLERPGQ